MNYTIDCTNEVIYISPKGQEYLPAKQDQQRIFNQLTHKYQLDTEFVRHDGSIRLTFPVIRISMKLISEDTIIVRIDKCTTKRITERFTVENPYKGLYNLIHDLP